VEQAEVLPDLPEAASRKIKVEPNNDNFDDQEPNTKNTYAEEPELQSPRTN